MFLLLMDVSLPLFLIPSPSKYIHTCIHTYIQSCVVEERKAVMPGVLYRPRDILSDSQGPICDSQDGLWH